MVFGAARHFKISEHVCGLLNVYNRSLPVLVRDPTAGKPSSESLRVSCFDLQLCWSCFSQLLGSPHCSRLRLSSGSFTDRQRGGGRERWQQMSFQVFRADPPQLQLQPSFPPSAVTNGCRAGETRRQGHRRSPQGQQESGELKEEMKMETEQNQKSSWMNKSLSS